MKYSREIKPGIFALQVEMPCNPSDLEFERYLLADTFGSAEQEEAAARLIAFSQDADNTWVGVSMGQFQELLAAELYFHNYTERPPGFPNLKLPQFTSLKTFGPRLVVTGLLDLINENMIETIEYGKTKSADFILCPTPKMIVFLLDCQQRRMAA
jgi:hypothetical protein